MKNYVRRAVLRLCSMDRQPVFGSRQQVPSAGMDFPHAKFISQDISQHTDMDRAWDYPAHRGETAPAGISCYCWRIVDLWISHSLSFHFHRSHFGDRDQIPLMLDA